MTRLAIIHDDDEFRPDSNEGTSDDPRFKVDLPTLASLTTDLDLRYMAIIGVTLASFAEAAKFGHLGIDVATHALSEAVMSSFPVTAKIGIVDRVTYVAIVNALTRKQKTASADRIRAACASRRIEFYPGELLSIMPAIGVVAIGERVPERATLYRRLAKAITSDMARRYPSEWNSDDKAWWSDETLLPADGE